MALIDELGGSQEPTAAELAQAEANRARYLSTLSGSPPTGPLPGAPPAGPPAWKPTTTAAEDAAGSIARWTQQFGKPGSTPPAKAFETPGAFGSPYGAAAAPAAAGPQSGDYPGWIQGLLGSGPATQEKIKAVEPTLTQYGVTAQKASDGSYRGRFYLPGGGNYDHPMAGYGGGGSQYRDPSTQQLEGFSQQWLAELERQRTQQDQANVGFRQTQAQAQAASERLTKFMQERAQKLQGPAYTGTEAEVLRTQALDPIERDRQAARQRALHNLSARGISLESGIAQQALNDVDAGYDRTRAGSQNQLAYRTIDEQRSREQEAQQLLGMIPQVMRSGASGDLQFLQALDAAVNQPRQTGLPVSSLLYDLPNNAMQQAMAALGLGSSPANLYNQTLGFGALQQGQRNQGVDSYAALGQMLYWLTQAQGQGPA